MRWEIDYDDALGSRTRRTISISAVQPGGLIQAYCEMRRDMRSFRVDRIRRAVDLETGEIVGDIPAALSKMVAPGVQHSPSPGADVISSLAAATLAFFGWLVMLSMVAGALAALGLSKTISSVFPVVSVLVAGWRAKRAYKRKRQGIK